MILRLLTIRSPLLICFILLPSYIIVLTRYFIVNNEVSEGMEIGFKRLATLEARFLDILKGLEPSMRTDYVETWNKRTKTRFAKFTKLAWKTSYRQIGRSSLNRPVKRRVNYSVTLSEFFRDELIARLEFYKRLRKELALILNKELHEFSMQHNLFRRYYGSMRFFDLYNFSDEGDKISEGNEGLLFEPDCEGYLDYMLSKCSSAESRANKGEYQQEYFFAVREYYKEVIKCVLRIANYEKYSAEQKKALLRYIAFHYVGEICNQENIWHHPCFGGTGGPTGTWRYNDFFERKSDKLNKNDLESLKLFLADLYMFINKNPRFADTLPYDPVPRDVAMAILGIKPLATVDDTIDLSYSGIDDIGEVRGLESLKNLQELYFRGNQIKEIKGLAKFANLHVLDLGENKIEEIKGLEKLKNLKTLDLENNQIKEIKSLENLTNLRELYLDGNPIKEDEQYLLEKSAQDVVKYCQEQVRTTKS